MLQTYAGMILMDSHIDRVLDETSLPHWEIHANFRCAIIIGKKKPQHILDLLPFCNPPPCWLCFPRPSLLPYSLVLNATWKGDLGTWGDFLGTRKVIVLAPAIVFEVSLSAALKPRLQMSLIKRDVSMTP